MEKLMIYFLNIALVALPLALFEILVEKEHGWGSGWPRSAWYARPFYPNSALARGLVRILKVEPLLVYHALVFGALLPLVFLLQYLFVTRSIALLLSCFFAVLVFEDLFWFLLNWHFDSRRQLLRGPAGAIWWHKNWLRIAPRTYIPFSYLSGMLASLALLAFA